MENTNTTTTDTSDEIVAVEFGVDKPEDKERDEEAGIEIDTEEESETEPSGSSSEDEGGEPKPATKNVAATKERSRLPKRVKDMYTSSDWWTLWIGLISFVLATAIVFLVPFEIDSDRGKYVIPQPMAWGKNPIDAWDVYGAVGLLLLMLVFGVVYILSKHCMGKIDADRPVSMYVKGFSGISALAVLSFWLGRQEWCSRNGLGYAIFAIVIGMILANVPLPGGDRLPDKLPWLKLVANDGEFFIKSSLVLLAVEFSVLGRVGAEAILVAWVGSPLALVAGFLMGTRLFGMDTGISLLVAVGSTWCGASAISAVAAIVESSSADISLSISVVAFFSVIFTFVQAYVAIGVGMPDDVAGAWIGGSVDQTGNVIASAAIISEEATEIAGITKIVLNSGLGILATIIAVWWQTRKEKQTEESERQKISLLFIWDKFPKFVLGYLLCSGILTVALPQLEGTPEGAAFQRAVLTLNKWWFSIAFVGIGVSTSIKDLWEGALKSGIIKLYLATNFLDIAIALGLAYTVF
jgi:uncharacterized membrane protein YadS